MVEWSSDAVPKNTRCGCLLVESILRYIFRGCAPVHREQRLILAEVKIVIEVGFRQRMMHTW